MDQPKPNSNGANGTSRWIRVLLMASLSLNLLIIGVFLGAMFIGGAHHGHHAPGLDRAGGPLTRALGPEDRRAIGRQMRQAYQDGRPGRAQQKAAFDAMIAALRQNPFDRAEVEARMQDMRRFVQARLALGQTLLLDRFEQMTPSDRAAYAERLAEQLNKRRPTK